VKQRLLAFAAAHRDLVAVHEKLQSVEAGRRAGRTKVARREKEVDAAVEALARAMIIDGHPRTKPFAALGSGAPSDLREVATRDKPKLIHQLAEAAQSSRAAGRNTVAAAQAADQAANKLQTAILALGPLDAARAELGGQRDTLGQPWDRALGVLRRAVHAAEDNGATGLYTALFGLAAPAVRKNGKAAPAPAPQPAPTPVSTA
jgi:hypothetical protein